MVNKRKAADEPISSFWRQSKLIESVHWPEDSHPSLSAFSKKQTDALSRIWLVLQSAREQDADAGFSDTWRASETTIPTISLLDIGQRSNSCFLDCFEINSIIIPLSGRIESSTYRQRLNYPGCRSVAISQFSWSIVRILTFHQRRIRTETRHFRPEKSLLA